MSLTEKLSILIDAKSGGAVKEFNKVAGSVENVEKSAGLGGKAMEKMASVTGMSVGSMKAGLAAAGVAAVAFAGDAIAAASDLGEQQAATGVIFKKSADDVIAFSKTTASALGISATAALEASNKFGDLFLNFGFNSEQAASFSEGLVRLAGDLASFKNLDTGDVLEKLQSGLVGESEPLRGLGIVINETAVKAKALELGLGGSNRELTEGEKVAARYALIIEKTGTAQGDAARTSDSLANKQRQLNAQWEDAKAKLGQVFIPIAAAAADTLADLTAAGEKNAEVTNLGTIAWRKHGSLWEQVTDVLIGVDEKTKDTTETQEKLAGVEKDLGLAAGTLTSQLGNQADAHKKAEDAAKKQAEALDALLQASISQFSAGVAYERSLNGIEDAVLSVTEKQTAYNDAVAAHTAKSPEAKAAMEELTRAQLDERDALINAAEAAVRLADDQAKVGGEGLTAKEKTELFRSKLMELANQADGPTRDAVRNLALAIKTDLPAEKTVTITVDTAKAIGNVIALGRALAPLPGPGGVIGVAIAGIGLAAQAQAGTKPDKVGPGLRASGGPVLANVPYTINEKGRETVTFPENGMVHPANLSPVGGGAVYNIQVYAGMGTDGAEVGRQIAESLKEHQRRGGQVPWAN